MSQNQILPEWDAHAELHQQVDRETCLECAIQAAHTARWEEAHADGPISMREECDLLELNRLDWVEYFASLDHSDADTVRRDRSRKIDAFIVAHHGEEVTLQQLMDECEAAQGTIYTYIRGLPLSFRRVGTSRYRVTDSVRARAEASTLSVQPRNDGAGSDAAPVAQIVTRPPSKP